MSCYQLAMSYSYLLPQRVNIAIMGFLALVVAYTMRACLAVAIIGMVEPMNRTATENSSICPMVEDRFDRFGNTTVNANKTLFTWTQVEQGWVLSSFYIGYVITHIPGGILAEKFGGKWTLSLGILSTAIFTILTPIAAVHGGFIAVIVLRILMGLGEGTTFPALSVLLAAWVPEKERSKLGSFVFGGGQIGSVLSYFISGLLMQYFVWNYVFYFWGIISIVWFIIFSLLCYSDPASDPLITDKERDYLTAEIGKLKRRTDLPPTPWIDIIKSIPMLSLICAQIGHDWGFYIMVSDLPKYMKDVLSYPVFEVGLYSSLPYIAMWLISVMSGCLSDYLIGRGLISITFARKLFTAVAAIFPGIFIIGASYSGCDRYLVVGFFVTAMGIMGTYYPGMKVNALDLSPNYAGSLMALTNGIGALTGVASPVFVGYMTPNTSLTEWRTVFWVTLAIFLVTTVVYCFGASGEIQLWNYPREWKEPEDKLDKSENREKKST
ncbi:sialin-like [Sitodiplosis mosellana]|uniref:sialin-like n=1 Tax=Sitodiplosis mosellana TaxID=263140 RepID=UPI0024449983|nr:sialin-like [Sitodiplosis mosellana]